MAGGESRRSDMDVSDGVSVLCAQAEDMDVSDGVSVLCAPEGRTWMLSEPCMHDMIQHITALLNNDNLWTASNAALVLARLGINYTSGFCVCVCVCVCV